MTGRLGRRGRLMAGCDGCRESRERELREAAKKVVLERHGARPHLAAADQLPGTFQWVAGVGAPNGAPVKPKVGSEAVGVPGRGALGCALAGAVLWPWGRWGCKGGHGVVGSPFLRGSAISLLGAAGQLPWGCCCRAASSARHPCPWLQVLLYNLSSGPMGYTNRCKVMIGFDNWANNARTVSRPRLLPSL